MTEDCRKACNFKYQLFIYIYNNRYERKFVSANVINLSSRHLSRDEISLLSKVTKFVPTPKHK